MSKNKNSRNKVIFSIKLFLGIILLAALLLWQENAGKVIDLFSNFKWHYLVVLFILGLVMNLISCLKWNLFLIVRGLELPITRLLGLYFIGKFFNNFMPSMIGGDLTRTYLLGRQINSQSKSFASVFLERFTGLIALIVLSITFSLINLNLLREPLIGISIASITLGSLILLFLILNPRFIDTLSLNFSDKPTIAKALSKLRHIHNDILYFKGKNNILLLAMVYSLIFHLLTSVSVYFCCLCINFHPSFLDIAVITPIILLLTTIPVSPNNLGWWEWAFSVLLVNAGAGVAQGLAVALTLRGMTFIFSIFGGILFLFEEVESSASRAT